MTPRYRWRLHPCPHVKSRYVVVQVFRTLGEMRSWAAIHGGEMHAASGRVVKGHRYRHALGICTIIPKDRAIAVVSVVQGYCGPRIVCHEFQHATMEYLRRYWLTKNREGGALVFGPIGEALAHFAGNLASDFWARCREVGIEA